MIGTRPASRCPSPSPAPAGGRSTASGPGPARLRVAHVVLSMDCGGLEHVVLSLAREAVEAGHEASVICLERPGELARRAAEAGAQVACLSKPPGLRPGLIRALARVLREHGPDVVHTHQVGALLYAGPAARNAGRPLVVHSEHGKHYGGRRRLRWLARLAGLHAARFFCVSEDIAAEVRSRRIVPDRKVRVIANGIDPDPPGLDRGAEVRRALGIPPHSPTIGTLGRLAEIKRQDVLIRAFARIRESSPEAHLLIVGDGPLRDELGRLVDDLGLAGCVHFAGYQAEPVPFLAAMNLFALTSRSEGMPLAVLEAWTARLPVVATRVGGLPELVDNGRTGLLVEAGDEAAIAGEIARVLADPELARRLGESGRLHAGRAYGIGRMAEDYRRGYRELLA